MHLSNICFFSQPLPSSSLQCPILISPDDASVMSKSHSQNSTIRNKFTNNGHTSQSGNINHDQSDQKVSKKVRDLVNFFDKAIAPINSRILLRNNEPWLNCAKHTDIESEMINNTFFNSEEKNCSKIDLNYKDIKTESNTSLYFKKGNVEGRKCPNSNLQKNLHMFDASMSDQSRFYDLNKSKSYSIQTPFQDPQNRKYFSQSNRSPSHHKLKPNTIENTQIRDHRNLERDEEAKSTSSQTAFSSEALKKNLEKVVTEVLGNSPVKNSKTSVINKPKTFIRRVNIGSGEQCAQPGFNSPNFYLPPRAFGCGSTTITSSEPKLESIESFHAPSNRFSTALEKPSHPFFKKDINISKSEEYLKNITSFDKVGGSEESLRPWSQYIIRRPHVTPKRSFIVEKGYKVTL